MFNQLNDLCREILERAGLILQKAPHHGGSILVLGYRKPEVEDE